MSQVRQLHRLPRRRCVCVILALACFSLPLFSQGYDDVFELKSKLKVELQYADYGEYEYPEPVIYSYGVSPYQQNQSYIANFPEQRGLIKYSRLLGKASQLSVKYQYSAIKEGVTQNLAEVKYTRSMSESVVGIVAGQYLYDSRGFAAYQAGTGALWDISPLTSVQSDIQYYIRGADSGPVGGKMGTVNVRLKARQVLTLSTAVQAEYVYYDAHGDIYTFNSHSVSAWISQFLKSQTAIHLSLRFYTNSMGISSIAPALEVAQYLNWATTLWLKFRYYQNKSDNVSLGEQGVIIPDNLRSRSFSLQVNREVSVAWMVYAKYRYYASNLGVQMNTYMLGAVYAF
jgi:hypothetical protein